jgi:hypothetical protein
MIITEEQWKVLDESYGKLFYFIACKVYGDKMVYGVEDCIQEVRISALNAVQGYHNKTGKKFEEFVGTEEFNKYIKKCIWNRKNAVGIGVTSRLGVTSTAGFDDELYDDLGKTHKKSKSDIDPSLIYETSSLTPFDDIYFDPDEQLLLSLMDSDSDCYTRSHRINISYIIKKTGLSRFHIGKVFESLKNKLKDYKS